MRHLVWGVLAHVDAGKTTLSEAILYLGSCIRKMGRVDHQNSFMDTDALEQKRGITIFSSQAEFTLGDQTATLMDTPGHVDFSAEMERTLPVLDYAILIISGADGIQGHTRTVWKLLKQYRIPTFLFVNKMDQEGCEKEKLLSLLQKKLSSSCVDVTGLFQEGGKTEAVFENIAMCDETALEHFLEDGRLEMDEIAGLVQQRKLFPCFFGSALKMQGVEELFAGMQKLSGKKATGGPFGARVYKIRRDAQGNRLTFLKVTHGTLRVRDAIVTGGSDVEDTSQSRTEKISQLRIYSGERYTAVEELTEGQVGAVMGPGSTQAGDGLGSEAGKQQPELEPVLEYQMIFPEGTDVGRELGRLRQLEEEYPELKLIWQEQVRTLHVRLMGSVQLEILKQLLEERYGLFVEFGEGSICYRETIVSPVTGVGHYEPLRHYAEVHLRMEPLPAGSGIELLSEASEDVLDRNWQRLILTHIGERRHVGVLTGSPVTDIRYTLVAGRAHLKHTEGGDFREAVYRAVRQGLMEAESLLLEPFYEFVIEIPSDCVGRLMTDLEQMGADYEMQTQDAEWSEFSGTAPVACLRDYGLSLLSYTRGMGHLFLNPCGYGPCHNSLEVQKQLNYHPEEDLWNPCGSIFCANGSGYYVPWDQVKERMHIKDDTGRTWEEKEADRQSAAGRERTESWLGTEQVDEILSRSVSANRRPERREGWHRKSGALTKEHSTDVVSRSFRAAPPKEKYLLVDGYNVIFAWEELKELAEHNLDAARSRLQDILCNYQGYTQLHLILVFDAYRLKNHPTECFDYHNIHVVYTKEAQTADQYIEQFAHEYKKKYDITVATSDGLEQIIIRGAGCHLLSAREFYEEVGRVEACIREKLGE